MKKTIISILSLLLGGTVSFSQTYEPHYQLIDPEGVYYNDNLAVATYNVLDYEIDNTGNEDCTKKVQALLDAAGGVGVGSNDRGHYSNPTGGVVYFPAGTYLFTSGKLVIPRGVSIRGDWEKPDGVSDVRGTVFAVRPTNVAGKGSTAYSKSFIVMQPTTLVSNITFWYPEQNADAVIEYPPTILYGENGYWGNEYCNVRHCTFLNSYTAIEFNANNGGGCPNIFDIYGTPLYHGFVMDAIADVGRFDNISFSADYWCNSGLPGAPSKTSVNSWLYENATAVVMKRNDWSYTCNLDVEGYNVGFHAEIAKNGGCPNGHNYGFNLKNCKTGVKITGCSSSGIMMTNVKTPGCHTGVMLEGGADGPVQFYDCDIDGNSAAINMEPGASSTLMFQDCDVTGPTEINGGHFQSVNSTYHKDVNIYSKARTLFADNTLKDGAKLNNKSIFQCLVANHGESYPVLPEFKREWMEIKPTFPAEKQLFIATDFGATPLIMTNTADKISEWQAKLDGAADNTAAIQKALDEAAAKGGGIVYLPVGHYRCTGNLVIPSGVELKGSGDIATVPKGNGSVLEVYSGEGDENGTPFITMEKASGLRGVTINYPRQTDPLNVKKYPYSVRGNADVYIVNLAMRATYCGVDLFTNKCDNHYVDYIGGHAFANVVRVGGGSENGLISNIQCNTIAYACGNETKFGAWLNSLQNTNNSSTYCQNERDLDFLIVGDTKNQILYNNFLYGCNMGMHFVDDGNGGAADCRSLGNAVDGAVNTFVIERTATDLDFINSQIVALNHNPANGHSSAISPLMKAYFIKTGPKFDKTVRFFSSDNWGSGEYMIHAEGGNVVMAMSNMAASGSEYTAHAASGASVRIFNSYFNGIKKFVGVKGDEPRFEVTSSVADENNVYVRGDFKLWRDNMNPAWTFVAEEYLLSRSGWKATASLNNGNASKAIDSSSSTRWDTGKGQNQAKGAWFAVDFGKDLTFNAIVLDTSESSGDGAGSYTVEAYYSGGWHEIAKGENGGSVTIVSFDEITASKVRVTLGSSSKGNYWSIHEFYVGNFDSSAVEDIIADETGVLSLDGDRLIVPSEYIGGEVEVYNLTGGKVFSTAISDETVSLSSLPKGICVIVVSGNGRKPAVMKVNF